MTIVLQNHHVLSGVVSFNASEHIAETVAGIERRRSLRSLFSIPGRA